MLSIRFSLTIILGAIVIALVAGVCKAQETVFTLNSGAISSFSANEGTIAVGTTDGRVFFKPALGVWSYSMPFGTSAPDVWAIIVFDNAKIVAFGNGSDGGLTVSHDGGLSWTLIGAMPPVRTLLFSEQDALFASTGSGVYRSIDDGLSWEDTGAQLNGVDRHFMTVVYDSVLVAASEFAGIQGHVNISWDGGATWEDSDEVYSRIGMLDALAPTPGGFVLLSWLGFEYVSLPSKERSQTARTYWFDYLSFCGSRTFAIIGREIVISDDGGDTWLSTGIPSTPDTELYPASDTTLFVVQDQSVGFHVISTMATRAEQQYVPRGNYRLSVYPNPTSSTLFVELEGNQLCGEIVVSDLHGKRTRLAPRTGRASGVCSFNVSTLDSGVYFITLTNGGNQFRGSFIRLTS